ncbi:hypothetical protein [Gloeobacter kilaueensis]|uniref:hypothetical protein n=1 Tax=Gloeobacter kilaueensis TaxID=1416614 RepID=UPI0003FED048|nr:hypothetical protein [Gloeobacter kilaueensis]
MTTNLQVGEKFPDVELLDHERQPMRFLFFMRQRLSGIGIATRNCRQEQLQLHVSETSLFRLK